MTAIVSDARGTTESPVRRENGLCARRGCKELGVLMRITRSGYVVLYCSKDYEIASKMFGGNTRE